MPLTRIEIEQTTHDNWHAEVEVGGMTARREAINAPSFDEVMIQVEDIYRKFMPSAPPLRAPAIAAQSADRAQAEIAVAVAQSKGSAQSPRLDLSATVVESRASQPTPYEPPRRGRTPLNR
jgi:hypothetical protein